MRLFSGIIPLILSLACWSSFAHAGNESHGGGIERSRPLTAAWFLDSARTVKTCVRVANGFTVAPSIDAKQGTPLEQPQAEELVRSSLEEWTTYLSERGGFEMAANGKSLASRFELQAGCASADLLVSFGEQTPDLLEPGKEFSNAYGFAANTGKPESPLWRRGVVWIAPVRSVDPYSPVWTAKSLHAVVLHELGHVFGNGHVPGTVMRADLDTAIRFHSQMALHMDEIDQERALFPSRQLQAREYSPAGSELQAAAPGLARILGRSPVAPVTLRLEIRLGLMACSADGRLVVTDANGTAEASLALHRLVSNPSEGQPILLLPTADGGHVGGYSANATISGTLTPAGAAAIPVLLQVNQNYHRFDLVPLDGDNNIPFFRN